MVALKTIIDQTGELEPTPLPSLYSGTAGWNWITEKCSTPLLLVQIKKKYFLRPHIWQVQYILPSTHHCKEPLYSFPHGTAVYSLLQIIARNLSTPFNMELPYTPFYTSLQGTSLLLSTWNCKILPSTVLWKDKTYSFKYGTATPFSFSHVADKK